MHVDVVSEGGAGVVAEQKKKEIKHYNTNITLPHSYTYPVRALNAVNV